MQLGAVLQFFAAVLAALTGVSTVSTVSAAPVSAATAATVVEVRAEADWILRAQMPDGAIAHHVDQVRVWPYLSNFAAIGLARATETTGDPRYAAAAWRWLGWYQAHMTAQGFVTDYVVTGGVAVSTGDMDSTDAYAGTYLLALRRTWRATRDSAALRAHVLGIERAVAAIEATQDVDGLTWAKPAWRVKYLMDQAETWAGLRAAADLAGPLNNPVLRRRASLAADRMQAGVDRLWNPATGAYDWAVHGDGRRDVTNWNVLYPDALQQVWAVAFGLVPGPRAKSIMATFVARHPGWDKPASAGYWPVAGLALRKVGDSAAANRAASNIRAGALATARAWPYTPGNAGQLIGLLSADGRL